MIALVAVHDEQHPHKKKHPREDNKDKGTQKAPRMQCTVCWKPAVRYYEKKWDKNGNLIRRKMVYEHRDEEPVRIDIYKGKKYKRYRRCSSGVVTDGLPFIEEKSPKPKLRLVKENELSDEQKQVIEIGRNQKEATPELEPDYKRLYFEQLSKYEKMKRKLLGLTTEL
jgi:hypothetical protein